MLELELELELTVKTNWGAKEKKNFWVGEKSFFARKKNTRGTIRGSRETIFARGSILYNIVLSNPISSLTITC